MVKNHRCDPRATARRTFGFVTISSSVSRLTGWLLFASSFIFSASFLRNTGEFQSAFYERFLLGGKRVRLGLDLRGHFEAVAEGRILVLHPEEHRAQVPLAYRFQQLRFGRVVHERGAFRERLLDLSREAFVRSEEHTSELQSQSNLV